MSKKPVIVYGASGYTGRLVCRRLIRRLMRRQVRKRWLPRAAERKA